MPPLSPERWRVLSPYLDQALEMGTTERSAWLASILARDALLGADLRVLLAEHDALHASGFLEADVPAREPAGSLAGQTLGAYRLVAPIGQGGMGSVWLAERCDGRFEGRAAVKLLNIALMGRAGEERFRREGHILARLTHPHIARLVDAGVSTAGQPYLVLEHVDGESIDRYCDARALGIDARLHLFLDVLEAVAHAHAHLIVHRDIKPANVLVSADGDVKLLDFGIAKLLEDETDDAAEATPRPLTREGAAVLTPEYAAPEQLARGEITTATDVYSLGVLLYLLLTGQHPAGDALRSPATLVQAIVGVEPRRMSDTIGRRTGAVEAIAHGARYGAPPHRLRRILRGDLDTIVAKALKKNSADRYASVTALAADIGRYLRHEPITARPDTLPYRAARFVRRHTPAVTSATAAVVLLAALTAFYTDRLAEQRDRAHREAAKAVKVSELLMGVMTSVDPYAIRPSPGEPTLRGVLDAGAEKVRNELGAQPDVQAEMLTMMGRTYRRLGAYDHARRLLEEALLAGRRAFGPEHVRVAQTLEYLGVVLADMGDYDGAVRTLEEALAMQRRLLGEYHAEVAVTLAELGRVFQDQGLNERAEPLHRTALSIRRQVLGETHRETAVSQSDLASVLRLNGDLAGAEALLRQCLDTNRKTRGEEHPNTAITLHDLALIAATRGDFRSAEMQLRRVLEMQRASLGGGHPIVATTLNNLSRVLADSHRYDAAAAALVEALDIARPAFGRDHQLVGIYTINLGAVQLARHDAAAAEALLREGLRVRSLAPAVVPSRRRTLLEDEWSPGATKSLLGATLVAQKRYNDAEAVLLEARRDLDAAPSTRPAERKATLTRLADLYVALGKPRAAAAYRAQLAAF